MSIAATHTALARGTTTRRELAEQHLTRIAATNAEVNAIVELNDGLLDQATQADQQLGTTIGGPLDGAIMSIKDSFAVAGLHRTDGVAAWSERVAIHDEEVVARLRAAGALVVGRTNVPDLCIRWNTISSAHGTTRNPRDLSCSAGGSSGGEAAAVAAGYSDVGLGADLGGSIRVPASFNRVYGMRPSAGLVPDISELPCLPNSMVTDAMNCTGPFARNVDDLARVHRVICGPHPGDPKTLPITLRESAARPRIAVMRDETGATIDDEISARLDLVVEGLREVGYVVDEHVVPGLQQAPEIWAQIIGTDLLENTIPAVGALIDPTGLQHIEEMFGQFTLGNDVSAYYQAWLDRRELMTTLSTFMAEYPIIVAPVAGMATPPLAFDHLLDAVQTRALFDAMRCVPWVNLFGLPSLCTPLGIQLVGARFSDLDLIAAARAIEPLIGPVPIAGVNDAER